MGDEEELLDEGRLGLPTPPSDAAWKELPRGATQWSADRQLTDRQKRRRSFYNAAVAARQTMLVWRGVAWCGVVWCGVVWCGVCYGVVVWRGAV